MKIKLSRGEWFTFSIFGLLLCLTPYLFTRDWGFLKFEDVGGTIGGVTAPFLSFFGSILVYLALKAQVKANRQVQDQFKRQQESEYFREKIVMMNEKINILNFEVNNFFYLYRDIETLGGPHDTEYKGSQAIYTLLSKNITTFYGKRQRDSFLVQPKFTELYKLLNYFSDTLTLIEREQYDLDLKKDEIIKSNFFSVLRYLFEAKIKWNFKALEDKKSVHNNLCDGDCGLNHGLPVELFDVVDEINEKLIMEKSN